MTVAQREFVNEGGNKIHIVVALGKPGCLCRMCIYGPHSEIESYTTRMELEQLRDAINEVMPPTTPASPAQVGAQPAGRVGCHDCGRPYGDEHGFPDLVIPDSAWRAISPKGNDGGLLCPSCICKRLHDRGIRCAGAFTSGPMQCVTEEAIAALLKAERSATPPTAGAVDDAWDRECVKCGHKWRQVDWGNDCPACEGDIR